MSTHQPDESSGNPVATLRFLGYEFTLRTLAESAARAVLLLEPVDARTPERILLEVRAQLQEIIRLLRERLDEADEANEAHAGGPGNPLYTEAGMEAGAEAETEGREQHEKKGAPDMAKARTAKSEGWGTDIGADGLTTTERILGVKDVVGLAYALRDLINKAGDGELVGGRLTSALADGPTHRLSGGRSLRVTIGGKNFILTVEEVAK